MLAGELRLGCRGDIEESESRNVEEDDCKIKSALKGSQAAQEDRSQECQVLILRGEKSG